MIKLEDVSTVKMLEKYPSSIKTEWENDAISQALSHYYIRDYQELEDLIHSGDKFFDIEFFRNWLDVIKKNIKYANEKGITTTQFTFNVEGQSGVNPKDIRTTDRKVFCRHLVINNPILGPSEQVSKIRDLRVYDAKLLLSKVVAHDIESVGQNAFLATYPTFSCEDILKLIYAIYFYEQQVVRQSQEPHQPGINLFRLNKQTKVEIITAHINDIMNHILDNAQECIWGPMTLEQKQMLSSALKRRKSGASQTLIERLIYMISNYTTLSEIKDGVKTKTLDRFIVK